MSNQDAIDHINKMIKDDYNYDIHDFKGKDLEALSLAKSALDVVDENYNNGYKAAIVEFSEFLISKFRLDTHYTSLRIREVIKENADTWAE